jgi:TPR repeat protein
MRGHAEAAYHLGWLYANGNGLRVDIPKAIHWWTQAASRGHTDAMFALGLTYTTGEGVEGDPNKALDWYIRAAKAGHEDAREMIRAKVWEGAGEAQERLPELVSLEWLGRPIRVKGDAVNLRSGPGTTFKQVGKVKKDTVLKAIGQRNDWYQVVCSAGIPDFCWIAGWLTEPIKE